jgi:hypothetical protein
LVDPDDNQTTWQVGAFGQAVQQTDPLGTSYYAFDTAGERVSWFLRSRITPCVNCRSHTLEDYGLAQPIYSLSFTAPVYDSANSALDAASIP